MIILSRCVIITSFQSDLMRKTFEFLPGDFILCADGGYSHARAEEIEPDMIIGDFDSIDYKYIKSDLKRLGRTDCSVLRVAAEKDDTDTMICLKYGMEQGYDEFYILGGLGGRLDHTIANLQTMSYAVEHDKAIWFLDGKNRATLKNPGEISVPMQKGFKISLFAFGDSCEGVTISGVKYPLENHLLINNFPLGVSNEFIKKNAVVSHKSGKLLIILSHD